MQILTKCILLQRLMFIAPLDAPTTITTINGLTATGGTNFRDALANGIAFFNSRNNNATNITYFLSDGRSNFGGDFSANAEELQNLSEVRAFGIGNADLDQLNIIDSDNAVMLNNPADLITEFNTATIDRNTIDRIEVKVDGSVVDTIAPDQLVEDTLGLQFEGTIDGLEVSREAENEITFDVIFNNGTPTTSLDYTITTGQDEVTQQTNNGTKEVTVFSVNQADFVSSPESADLEREIVGNDLDNVIEVQSGQNTIFGNGGNDRFVITGGTNLVDGGEGIDTAVINSTQEEAGEISQNGDVTNIGADNTLLNVEFVEFNDTRLSVDTLAVAPIVSFPETGVEITELDADSTNVTFTVNLSSIATEDVVIDFATRSDSAETGTDFVETSGQLTIAAGETSGDINIEILGDTDIEGDESVFLDLTTISGGTFADGVTTETAGVNIIDNDRAIDVSIIADDPSIVEGSPDTPSTFTLTLDRFGGLSGSDSIAVEIVPLGDNPVQSSDFVNGFLSTEVNFEPNEQSQSIEIPISPDTEIEGNETFGVRLTSISGSALISTEDTIFTILDDETTGDEPSDPIDDEPTESENVQALFSDGISAVTTTEIYDGQIKIDITGVGQAAGSSFSDAFYRFTDNSGDEITPELANEFGLYVNGEPAELLFPQSQSTPAYSSDHSYSFVVDAPGGNLTFGVGDLFTEDNTGSYDITISEI